MKDLNWAMTLYDKMSANADTMASALAKLDKQLNVVKKDGAGLQNMFGGFGGPVGSFVGGLKYAANTALNLGMAVGSIAVGFGQAALEALGFKEATLVSFKSMTGSADQAQISFDRAMKFADLTPFGSKDVVQQMKMIMGAGFKQERAEDIFAALSDVAAVSGGGAPAMQGMLVQMAQAKAIGKFQMQDLKAIMSHAGPAGVSMSSLYDQLAQTTGRSREGIATDLSAGTIDAETGIQALLEVIQRDVSKGKLGQASLDQGSTIGGLMSTIESLPEKLFYGIDLNSAGVAGLKSFLQTLISTFDTLVGKGGKLTGIVESMGNSIGGMLAKITPEDIISFVTTAVDGITLFADIVRTNFLSAIETFNMVSGGAGQTTVTFADTMRYLGLGVSFVVQVLATLAGVLALVFKGWDMLINGIDWGYLWEQFKNVGVNIVDGLVAGLKMQLGLLRATLDVMSYGISGRVEQALGIQSPSKVFAEIGRQTAAGFAVGVQQGTGEVSQSFSGLTMPQAGMSLAAGGARSVFIADGAVRIEVQGNGLDSEGIARHLAELLPDSINKLVVMLTVESGEPVSG